MRKLIQFFEARKRLTLFIAVLWTVLIFIGCSMPGKELPKLGLFDHFDKVVHFTFFAVFFALWSLINKDSVKYIFIIFICSILYGFGIEYYQLYCVAGRSFDVWDGVADSLGALCGWVIIKCLNPK